MKTIIETLSSMNANQLIALAVALAAGWTAHAIRSFFLRRKARKTDDAGAEYIASLSDFELIDEVIKGNVKLPKRIRSLFATLVKFEEGELRWIDTATILGVLAGDRKAINYAKGELADLKELMRGA